MLCRTVKAEEDDIMSLLLDKGVSADAVSKHGNSALFSSARHGKMSKLKLLLAKGADIEKRNRAGQTPLELFFTTPWHGKSHILNGLLEYNANTSKVFLNGKTPLTALCSSWSRQANEEIYGASEMLIQHGADAFLVDGNGDSALWALCGSPEAKSHREEIEPLIGVLIKES